MLILSVLTCGGCSVSLPMGGLGFETDTTGSLPPKPLSPLSPDLNVEDWRRAKGALALALDPVGSGTLVAWDNPDSGLKGTIVPVGSAYVRSEEICRAFVATLGGQAGPKTLQGTGCRLSGADWAIKDVKPWRKPS